jgi:hypothetical protein
VDEQLRSLSMAIAMMVEIPGLTQEQYEAAAAIINQGGPQVGGALIHTAGSFDGGCRVVEVWESQELADAFYGSALFGQIAAQMPQPKITSWPLYSFDGAGLK